jgi:hypothetical protein
MPTCWRCPIFRCRAGHPSALTPGPDSPAVGPFRGNLAVVAGGIKPLRAVHLKEARSHPVRMACRDTLPGTCCLTVEHLQVGFETAY